jgi:hypothetical protein
MEALGGSQSAISNGFTSTPFPVVCTAHASAGTMRSFIWIGIFTGSTIGGMIPSLWGEGVLSYSSVLLSGIGAFAGLWVAYKLSV